MSSSWCDSIEQAGRALVIADHNLTDSIQQQRASLAKFHEAMKDRVEREDTNHFKNQLNPFDPYANAQVAADHVRPQPKSWPVTILRQPKETCFKDVQVIKTRRIHCTTQHF